MDLDKMFAMSQFDGRFHTLRGFKLNAVDQCYVLEILIDKFETTGMIGIALDLSDSKANPDQNR